jgi:hypothetical protein
VIFSLLFGGFFFLAEYNASHLVGTEASTVAISKRKRSRRGAETESVPPRF